MFGSSREWQSLRCSTKYGRTNRSSCEYEVHYVALIYLCSTVHRINDVNYRIPVKNQSLSEHR